MHRTLEVPEPLYAALEKAAETRGLTPLAWIADRLAEESRSNGTEGTPAASSTLAERFAGRIGRIRSGGQERLSEDCGTKFADHLEAKT